MKWNQIVAGMMVATACLFLSPAALRAAFPMPGGTNSTPTYTPLDTWTFRDSTNWPSDKGYAPISFANLTTSVLGNGCSLAVNSNVPAWLQYNVMEASGATNLAVSTGALTFWFAPADWSSTNAGGTGPGAWAQLVTVGQWTTNAMAGYWGLAVDPAGSNLWFQVQDGLGNSYNLSAPIAWTTNYFHFVALTYSSTNVSLYLDGALAASDAGGLNILPSASALAGGMYFGSDTNGLEQAQGLFDSVATYSVPVDGGTLATMFVAGYEYYILDPYNVAMNALASGQPVPTTSGTNINVITGSGNLQWVGAASVSITNANVWITNLTVTAASGGSMNMTFTIQGGQRNTWYDVFANSVLSFGSNGVPWTWMGQGTNSGIYSLTVASPNETCLILGTPQMSSPGSYLTDAYQLLVSKTNPSVTNSDLDGLPTGWEILLGLDPHVSNFANNGVNYTYTTADWLTTLTGVKTGIVNADNEGNLTQVSQ